VIYMKEAEFWFVVSNDDDSDMTEDAMNDLLDAIIDLVEARKMLMGGGAKIIDYYNDEKVQ
jgi:hypothetical protein